MSNFKARASTSLPTRRFLFPPVYTHYGEESFGMPILEWISKFVVNNTSHAARLLSPPPLSVIQRAGDVLYVPAEWGHAVLNLDPVNTGVAMQMDVSSDETSLRLRAAAVQAGYAEDGADTAKTKKGQNQKQKQKKKKKRKKRVRKRRKTRKTRKKR